MRMPISGVEETKEVRVEVPPAWPWWAGVALAGGAGLIAVGAVIALEERRKEQELMLAR